MLRAPLPPMTRSQDASLVSALRIDLYECDRRPAEIMAEVRPRQRVTYAWIPQTIADQIWVLYGFPDRESRAAWEASLPPEVARWLSPDLFEIAIRYLQA